MFGFDLIKNVLQNAKELNKNEKIAVYDIITNALNETRTFIANNRIEDLDRPSHILSNTWREAATALKRINNPVLEDCIHTLYEKSKYWSDPDRYDLNLMNQYKMRLDEVEITLIELTA